MMHHLAKPASGVQTVVTMNALATKIGTIHPNNVFQVTYQANSKKWKACRDGTCHDYACGEEQDHICIWGVAFLVRRSIIGEFQVWYNDRVVGKVHQTGCEQGARRRRTKTQIGGTSYPNYYPCATCSDGGVSSHVWCKSCERGYALMSSGVDHTLPADTQAWLKSNPKQLAAMPGLSEGVCMKLSPDMKPTAPKIYMDNAVAINVGTTLSRRRSKPGAVAIASKVGIMSTIAAEESGKCPLLYVECAARKTTTCGDSKGCEQGQELECTNICKNTEMQGLSSSVSPGEPGSHCPTRDANWKCTDLDCLGSEATIFNLCSSVALVF